MKKVFFVIASVAIMALVLVGCSGKSNSNSQSSNSNNSTQSASQGGGSTYNPRDHYTAVDVNIDFVENWMLPTDGVITEVIVENEVFGIYRVRVEGISKAQCEKYEETLKSRGMVFGFDTCNNADVVIDFTKTYLRDNPEDSTLTLRFNKR